MSKYLTEHFSLEEMTHSAMGSRRGMKNEPDEVQVENLKALCEKVLEPLREHLGTPVRINSGFRSKEVNKLVGGKDNSQHLRGQAADLMVHNTQEMIRMMHFIMDETDFDQLILERNKWGSQWVHVSHKRDGGNRHQVLSRPFSYS
ncbi:MAG: D-Ala-D-Ala carboxypeptidase family metallohydrolase [Prevotella sp.]|nr:D-Ala-D-Ala carboxypeptidase family metallohydrolase [Prevotella sp.]